MAIDILARGQSAALRQRIEQRSAIDKLKRAYDRALDPWARPPLIPAPAYANNRAMLPGEVFTANSNLYVVIGAGTTAAGGSGPSAGFGTVNDGSVIATYYGAASAAVTGSDAPTVTMTTTNQVSTLPNIVSPEPWNTAAYIAGAFRPIGGEAINDGANRIDLRTFDRGAGGSTGKYTSWEFDTDAPSLALRFRTIANSRAIGVTVDGSLLGTGGLALPAGGQCWVRLDFPAGVERRMRRIRVNHAQGGDVRFADLFLGGRDTVAAPTGEQVRGVFISDSIFDGSSSGPMLPGASAPQRIAAALGWDDPWCFTQGGTGYLNPGTGPYKTFRERVAEAAERQPDAWVLFGSTNDGGYPAAAITAEVLATLKAIRRLSAAPVFVMGVWSVNAATPALEAAVKAGFDLFGDPMSAFIPVSTPTSGLPWVTGSWNNAGHSASSTAGYAIGSDAVHPLDGGTALLSRRAAESIRLALTAMGG